MQTQYINELTLLFKVIENMSTKLTILCANFQRKHHMNQTSKNHQVMSFGNNLNKKVSFENFFDVK
ncbi:hypothetical protein ND2E_2495 [Colwellia psychrerythraea]|uniref:Uncharacterized protein n=1 Tax=Colwellia psychrerythraea TaxID=28229 RepID=A0A099KQJ4_COLPS|nr:hypothetical protein ND2E_2495 [Colwellia psychrerythraea]